MKPSEAGAVRPRYVVAVRALCEFTAKAGDLDLRFTPSPSAQEGVAGHALVTARRGAGYEAEVSLSGEYGPLLVRGRADGYDAARNRLEEIKTRRGDAERVPDNHRALHWAQVKIYGWLLCSKLGLAEIELAVVYLDLLTQQETVLCERQDAASLRAFFEAHCARFVAWAEQELAHRAARDGRLEALRFPHDDFRPGQRPLAEAVYRGVRRGKCLAAQAPTGIGKTLGTLFPLLKACPGEKLDKIFFLAAKTPGRRLALDAMDVLLGSNGAEIPPGTGVVSGAAAPAGNQGAGSARTIPVRVLELVSRDTACEHPDKACHGESCPLAQGFYDKLPQARSAALRRPRMDRAALRAVALTHQVCPYYLGQDLVRWSDVVVGDYNYYFDLSAMLFSLAQANQWRVSVLVDEAHNLVERARKMYSAELDQAAFRNVRKHAPAALRRAFDQVNRNWSALNRTLDTPYAVCDAAPAKFLTALQKALAAVTEHMALQPEVIDGALQNFYFEALHFCRIAELFGPHSLFDITLSPDRAAPGSRGAASVLCFRNVVPAPFLTPRFAAARSVALFSATLSPPGFYRATLGLPEDTAWVDVPSPFAAEQLSVHVVRRISTRYRHRDDSLVPIAALMARQFQSQPGNYLAFFSSYDYLHKVAVCFSAHFTDIPVWEQARRMGETERDAFLARFTPAGAGIGFAVLGGPFAEGIDLPGARLIGAFVATLGLPQVNPVNEQMRQRMASAFGAAHGYDYAYLFPGMQKVVQAAGRVIRTQSDRGVVFLIDDRFARPEVMQLLPRWWQVCTEQAPGAALPVAHMDVEPAGTQAA